MYHDIYSEISNEKCTSNTRLLKQINYFSTCHQTVKLVINTGDIYSIYGHQVELRS